MDENVSAHDLLIDLKNGFGFKDNCLEDTERAIKVLYTHYAKRFYSYALHRGLSSDDADDVVDDTFERILNGLEDYHEAKAGGEKWMWRICANVVIDKLRRDKRLIERLPDNCFLPQYPDPACILEEDERSQALHRAWNRISEKDRQELRQGRGRGPGRKEWHKAVVQLRSAFFEEWG